MLVLSRQRILSRDSPVLHYEGLSVCQRACFLSVCLSESLSLSVSAVGLKGEEGDWGRGGRTGGSPAGFLSGWSEGKRCTSGVILAVVVHNSSCFTPQAGSHRGCPLLHQQHCSSTASSGLYHFGDFAHCWVIYSNNTKIEINVRSHSKIG